MAHKKGGGSTSNGRDSIGKRLGVKRFDAQFVKAGNIIVRQRGSRIWPGIGCKMGSDFTVFAARDGYVKFYNKRGKKFVGVFPAEELKSENFKEVKTW